MASNGRAGPSSPNSGLGPHWVASFNNAILGAASELGMWFWSCAFPQKVCNWRERNLAKEYLFLEWYRKRFACCGSGPLKKAKMGDPTVLQPAI